jgi:hypothetical protein
MQSRHGSQRFPGLPGQEGGTGSPAMPQHVFSSYLRIPPFMLFKSSYDVGAFEIHLRNTAELFAESGHGTAMFGF